MVTDKRISEVVNFYKNFGMKKACEKYNINSMTVMRYEREARIRNLKIEYDIRMVFPNILVFDIEFSTAIAEVWRTGKQYISGNNITHDNVMISWKGLWLNNSGVEEPFGDCVSPKEILNRDDKRIVESLYEAIEEADIVIGHNIKYFDLPKARSKFVVFGLKPLAPFQVIDTLRHLRKKNGFLSNSLSYISDKLNLTEQKRVIHKELWDSCMCGDQEALDNMLDYNGQDVVTTAELYLYLRPYMKSHPNLAVYVEGDGACPCCLTYEFERVKDYYTTVNKYPAYRCENCGHIVRGKSAINNWRYDNSKRLRSVAR